MKIYMKIENYDCFGNYYKDDKIVEGFSHHTYKDRYCIGESANIYKRINLEKRDILKKNPCNSCWCKNKDKYEKLDNLHKFLYCKKGEKYDGDLAMKIKEVNSKIKKYDRILLLKKSLEKLERDEKLIKDLESNKIKNVDESEFKDSIEKTKKLDKELINLDNFLENKKKSLIENLDRVLDEQEDQEEKDIMEEKKEIDELNKKEIDDIRKNSDKVIAEITKLKLTEQEKSMTIIKLKEELEEYIVEIGKLKKMFTGNKDNLMETKNLLFKCENTREEKLDCPNYNITFFIILFVMILYTGYVYINFYDKIMMF